MACVGIDLQDTRWFCQVNPISAQHTYNLVFRFLESRKKQYPNCIFSTTEESTRLRLRRLGNADFWQKWFRYGRELVERWSSFGQNLPSFVVRRLGRCRKFSDIFRQFPNNFKQFSVCEYAYVRCQCTWRYRCTYRFANTGSKKVRICHYLLTLCQTPR